MLSTPNMEINTLTPKCPHIPAQFFCLPSNDNIPYKVNGYFMGYSNIIYFMLYYDPHKNIVKIIYHAYVNEHDIWIHPKELFKPGSLLIHEYPNGKYAPDCAAPPKIKLVKYQINIINYPFDPVQILSIFIEIPPIGKYISISIMDNATLNISYISQLYNDLLLFSHLPADAWYNLCIAAIGSEDTIMTDSYSDELRRHKIISLTQ